MRNRDRLTVALVALVAWPVAWACGDDGDGGSAADSGPGADAGPAECPVVISDADCDTSQRPIVFVHGTFGSADNIAHVALLFASNGFCADRFLAVDYNSLGEDPLADLDALIDQALADTGLDKVELMGHSQGTRHSYDYLADPAHAAKVAHYVHLAGGPRDAPPGGVPTLSISSQSDSIATAAGVTGAEETVVLQQQDHFAVASSTETFVDIYRYLRGEDPAYTEVQCGDEEITLEARAESFADNVPPAGATVEIYEVGDEPRALAAPVQTFTVGADGRVGPWRARRLVAYDIKAIDVNGATIGHLYFAPFERTNRLLRLLVPSAHPLASIVTSSIVADDRHTVVIARSFAGAFRADLGDSFRVNGTEVLNQEIANAGTATVGLFLFDDNLNGASDGGSVAAYSQLPFIRATDVFMDASAPAFIDLTFDGTTVRVPNWPSVSEGPTFVVFP